MAKDPDVTSNRARFISDLLRNSERKSLPRIMAELLILGIRNGRLPNYYFSRRLYLKGIDNIHDFIPDQELAKLEAIFNHPDAIPVLGNKLFFYLYYSRFTDKIAKIFMFNNKNNFVVDNENYLINSAEELEKLLYRIICTDNANGSVFIKKTFDSYGGWNIYRLEKKDFPLDRSELQNLYINITSSAYLFQERIIQHPELDIINPSCVNTLRIDTFTDRHGNVKIIYPYLRMSISNTHIDNLSSGGCAVGVDPDTGRLRGKGFTSISRTGGKIITEHPLTNVKFDGLQLPFFEETLRLVTRFAELNPCLRLIGWDIAITGKGPVMIEGNSGYDMGFQDLVFGGLRKNKVFMEILDELTEIRKGDRPDL